jgi:hypothetical protein
MDFFFFFFFFWAGVKNDRLNGTINRQVAGDQKGKNASVAKERV